MIGFLEENEKQEIDKWIVLDEIETNEGVEVIQKNGTSNIYLEEDEKDILYYLVDNDFVSAYIERKENRMFIDRIYLNLKNNDNMILEII